MNANDKRQHSLIELRRFAAWQKLPTHVMWRLAVHAFENGEISESIFSACEDFTAREPEGLRAAEAADVTLARIRADTRRTRAVKP